MHVESNKPITLKEIAKRAETSTMAVSVVLNGARSNTRVSDATRHRILSIASNLNYTPNAMARGLKRQRTNTLGVLFNWAGSHALHSLYAVAILDGIVAGAAKAGYHILLYTEGWRNAQVSSSAFSDQRADGIVVVAPRESSDVVPGLVALGMPVTVLSSITDVAGVPYVAIDNHTGVTAALEHLRALGHTRIAFAGQATDRVSMRERYETYCAWMGQHGLAVPAEYVQTDYRADQGNPNTAKLQHLLESSNRPTAIFAVTDDLASEILDTAQGMGISVPGQLSVIGFDDILVASLTVPKLTTVRLPLLQMGQQAAHLLIESIEKGSYPAQQAHIATPELIVRASTAAPPTAPTFSPLPSLSVSF